MREIKQTLAKARRLARQAEESEYQAESYLAIRRAIEGLGNTIISDDLRRQEMRRYQELADEMYEDADDLRGQVDTDLIDQL